MRDMLSKKVTKYVSSLQIKKYRKLHQSFLTQGEKSVEELLISDYKIELFCCTEAYFESKKDSLENSGAEIIICKQEELERIGTLKSNDSVLAVAKQKDLKLNDLDFSNWVIALDRINDPGNLGTIIRLADWYGIKQIIAGEGTADFYNPKTVLATMGSFTRVNVFACDLPAVLKIASKPVYGAYLKGQNVHEINEKLSSGILLMGNEAQGIAPELESFVTEKLTIPKFGNAESLNVGIATAILLDNIKRLG